MNTMRNRFTKEQRQLINKQIHYLVPESQSYDIYISKQDGYTANCVFKYIYITSNYANAVLSQEEDSSVALALIATIGHEIGHNKDYQPTSILKQFLVNYAELTNGFGLKHMLYIKNKLQFYLWLWEVHADFYGCKIGLDRTDITRQLL